MAKIAALIVAAGSGERAGGGLPKQYRALAGVPLLRRTVDAFAQFAGISEIQVVIGPGQDEQAAAALNDTAHLPPVIGGKTRQDSVRNGLEAIAAHAPDFVLIQDAARPFVSARLVERLVSALESGADCAIPLVAVADTLKLERSPGVWTTVPRDGLMRAQTPQGFRFEKILAAHRDHADAAVTDDMALAELAGLKIAAVVGEEVNMKITTAEDFVYAERLMADSAEFRTGSGIDARRMDGPRHSTGRGNSRIGRRDRDLQHPLPLLI